VDSRSKLKSKSAHYQNQGHFIWKSYKALKLAMFGAQR